MGIEVPLRLVNDECRERREVLRLEFDRIHADFVGFENIRFVVLVVAGVELRVFNVRKNRNALRIGEGLFSVAIVFVNFRFAALQYLVAAAGYKLFDYRLNK